MSQCKSDQGRCVCYLTVIKVRILFSHGDWETELLSFQRKSFQILENVMYIHLLLDCGCVYIKGDRGRIYDCKFFVVNALRKGDQRPISKCWLEQTADSIGNFEFSHVGTLWGLRVILGWCFVMLENRFVVLLFSH